MQVKDQLLALMTELVDLPPDLEYRRPTLLQQRQQLATELQRLEGCLSPQLAASRLGGATTTQASAPRQAATPSGLQAKAQQMAQHSVQTPGGRR